MIESAIMATGKPNSLRAVQHVVQRCKQQSHVRGSAQQTTFKHARFILASIVCFSFLLQGLFCKARTKARNVGKQYFTMMDNLIEPAWFIFNVCSVGHAQCYGSSATRLVWSACIPHSSHMMHHALGTSSHSVHATVVGHSITTCSTC